MARKSRLLAALAALGIFAVGPWAAASYIEEEFSPGEPPARPIIAPASPHVPELARYLARLNLAEPLVFGRLAVVPIARPDGALEGAWLTMDQARRVCSSSSMGSCLVSGRAKSLAGRASLCAAVRSAISDCTLILTFSL